MISNTGSFPESGAKRWTTEEVIANLQEHQCQKEGSRRQAGGQKGVNIIIQKMSLELKDEFVD